MVLDRENEALTAVNASFAETKEIIGALLLKAAILLRGDDNLSALEILTAAVNLDPYSVPARIQRANLYIAMNQDAKARTDIAAAIEVNWHDIPLALTNALLMMRGGTRASTCRRSTKIAATRATRAAPMNAADSTDHQGKLLPAKDTQIRGRLAAIVMKSAPQ